MIGNRFIIDDDGIITDMSDLSMYIDNEECCEKLNELNDEKQKLREDLDAFIEQNAKLHSKISELRRELQEQEKEHQEDKFKLNTLEKHYTCPNCAFNKREFAYLQSLKRE